MKILRIRLELTIESDKYGLHSMSPEVRDWIDNVCEHAAAHGFSVTTEPPEDAKEPVQVRKRTRGPGKRKANGERTVDLGGYDTA